MNAWENKATSEFVDSLFEDSEETALLKIHKTFKLMHGCCLREGAADGTIIEIAPTMKSLFHGGEKYNRVSGARRVQDGKVYAIYLWDGWFKQQTE